MRVRGGLTSRGYADQADLEQMRRLLMDGRRRSGGRGYAHVGLLAWDFFMVACHLDPARHLHLWHDDRSRLAGYALLGEDPRLDWQVAPRQLWTGVEEEALAWAEALVAGLRQEDPARWGGALGCWSAEDDARRRAFLEGHGFRPRLESSEVELVRSLAAPPPEAALPPGYQVRGLAGPGEAVERAAAHREVWHPWTVGEVSAAGYRKFMGLPGYDPALDVVAVATDGTVAAYANCWLDPVNRVGNIGPVGARPAHRRRGLTRAVLFEGLRRMRAAGMERACVSTGVSNDAAQRLYCSVGFAPERRHLDYGR